MNVAPMRAEWLKLTTTRMWWILFLVAAALTILATLPVVIAADLSTPSGAEEATLSGDVSPLFAAMSFATIIAQILGILTITGEYRHRTVGDTFLAEPRRHVVIAAKSAVSAVAGVLLSMVTCAITVIVIVAALNGHRDVRIDGAAVALIAVRSAIDYALFAVLGVGIGALVRVQAGAIVAALLWFLIAETTIAALWPTAAHWLPGSAGAALVGTDSPVDQFSPLAGGAVLACWAIGLTALAAFTTIQRDVT